jgi:preprotein translocase subunit SecD
VAWDALTRQQFHQIIGVVVNGQVMSAPITQPAQSAWSSFNGQVQISGSFTEKQAKAIAAEF